MRLLIALTMLAVLLGFIPAASAEDSARDPRLRLASADGQNSDQKQSGEEQKKDDEPEKTEDDEKSRAEKKKRGEEGSSSSSSSGSDSDCFTDCLSGLALFDLIFGGSDEKPEADQRSFIITDEYEEPLTGTIDLGQETTGEAMAWNIPGGELAGSGIVYHIPMGADVLIWKRAVALGDTAWLEVSQAHAGTSRGWVRERDVVIRETPPAAMLAAGAAVEGEEVDETGEAMMAKRPVAILRGDVSWYTFLGEPLWGEYDGRGYQFRAMAHMMPVRSLQIGLGAGYARGHGNPKFVYETPYLFDEPLDSDLYILSLELQFGQLILLDEGDSFIWGIGPTAFKIKESAEIAYTEYEDGTPGRSGIRTDTMERWVLGWEGRIALVHTVKGKYPIGVVTGFSFIPWDSQQEESLTLDWLNHNYFFTYQLGLTWGVSFF